MAPGSRTCASWRGLLVLVGTMPDAQPDGHYFRAGEARRRTLVRRSGRSLQAWCAGGRRGSVEGNASGKAGEPSEPYLMTNFNGRESVTLAHDGHRACAFHHRGGLPRRWFMASLRRHRCACREGCDARSFQKALPCTGCGSSAITTAKRQPGSNRLDCGKRRGTPVACEPSRHSMLAVGDWCLVPGGLLEPDEREPVFGFMVIMSWFASNRTASRIEAAGAAADSGQRRLGVGS